MKNTPYDLGIRCDTLITMDPKQPKVLAHHFVGICQNTIMAVEPWNNQTAKFSIHKTGQLVMPGLINGHSHLAMCLFRGIAEDLPFKDWLFNTILPLEKKVVNPEFVRTGTALGLLESIRFGVTTINDMYFFPAEVAAAFDQSGLRGLISCAISDHPTPDDLEGKSLNLKAARQLNERYLNHSRLSILLGPHAPYSCSDTLLKTTQTLSAELELPIHIHVSETSEEIAESIQTHGKTPVKRLHDLGILNGKTSCAHMVHPTAEDISILARSGASVVHNPQSNMKLGSGVSPIGDMIAAGVKVGLGTDGAASNNNLNILEELGSAAQLQNLFHADHKSFTSWHALELATIRGAHALGLGALTGSIEIGKRADLIFLDLDFPHMQPVHNVVSQLVYSATGLEVTTTICDGRILMLDGNILSLARGPILQKARSIAERIRV